MKVGDIMAAKVVSVRPETPYKAALELLVRSDVSGLPVIDETGQLVGIVTEADLVAKEAFTVQRRRALATFVDVLIAPEWVKKSDGKVVAEFMTKDVSVCEPGDDPREVARRMLERRVKRMPVVQSGEVVGIVTRNDILSIFARPDDEIAADVRTVLSSHPNRPDDFHVDSSVDGGIVTLTGDVHYGCDEPVLTSLVRDVDGVINVLSRIHHREPDPRSATGRFRSV